MISKVLVRNFKCLRDVQVDLERFTVLVGPNASGKSSILRALDILCRTFRMDHPQQIESELQRSLSRGASERIELAAESGGKAYRYRVQFPSSSPTFPSFGQEPWDGDGLGVATSLARSDWKQWPSESSGSMQRPLPK